MANRPAAASMDEYIAEFPPEARRALEEIRALVRAAAPAATERISYEIPAFDLDGRYLVYFAGWKRHVSLYPVPAGVAQAFEEELRPYRRGKGTLRFPLGRPMPAELIRRIVDLRVAEVTGGA